MKRCVGAVTVDWFIDRKWRRNHRSFRSRVSLLLFAVIFNRTTLSRIKSNRNVLTQLILWASYCSLLWAQSCYQTDMHTCFGICTKCPAEPTCRKSGLFKDDTIVVSDCRRISAESPHMTSRYVPKSQSFALPTTVKPEFQLQLGRPNGAPHVN